MTKLRKLARQYSDGLLDEETYRTVRTDFITQVIEGAQPLEVNEYLPPLSGDDAEGGRGAEDDAFSPALFVLDDEQVEEGPSALVRGLFTLAVIILIIAILVFGIRLF